MPRRTSGRDACSTRVLSNYGSSPAYGIGWEQSQCNKSPFNHPLIANKSVFHPFKSFFFGRMSRFKNINLSSTNDEMFAPPLAHYFVCRDQRQINSPSSKDSAAIILFIIDVSTADM